MFKFIHAADIHLDSPLRGLERYEGAPVSELRGATRKALEHLVQLSLDEEVAFLIIAGDIYDGDWKDYNTGLFFARQMSRLRQAGIKTFLIRGNHDAASQITRELTLPENVYEFPSRKPATVVLEEIGVAIHGQSFSTQSVTENLAANYPIARQNLFNIGVLHTSADGREGHENYAPCAIGDLLSKGYDYWALGHIHQREELHRDPWIVFSGNTQGRHIREIGSKGCTLVSVGDGRISSVEHKALDVARWTRCVVQANSAANIDELLERTRQALFGELNAAENRFLAVRITVQGASPAHKTLVSRQEQFVNECRALGNDLGDGKLWIEQVQIQTRVDFDLNELAKRIDPVGELLSFVRNLPADETALEELLSEFSALRQKLPLELRQGVDAINFDDPNFLRQLFPEVEQILLPRLLESEAVR